MSSPPRSRSDVRFEKAQEFVDRVVEGEDPEEVSKEVGVSPKNRTIRELFEKAKEEALSFFVPDPSTRRQMVIGRMLKNVALGDDKDSAAAARVLKDDPEMGFATQQSTGMNITLEVIQGIPGSMRFKDAEKIEESIKPSLPAPSTLILETKPLPTTSESIEKEPTDVPRDLEK